MKEKVFRFGKEENLLGVLTEPKPDAMRPELPVILWLNAGVLHHVGPFGWYVTLARRLAEMGAVSFRFDLSGLGDSPGRDKPGGTLDHALLDVKEAMDFLGQKRQVKRFVVIGVCSGAILAQQMAVRDERVAGVVQFDGYGFPTLGFYLRYYGARLFQVRSWLGAAGRLLKKVARVGRSAETMPDLLSESFYVEFPQPAQALADLGRLMSRGARCLVLYTGTLAGSYFNHRRQFHEMFGNLDPSGKSIEVDFLPQADHLFSAHEQRQAMFERVAGWVQRF